jgi:hypothetical protein
VAGGLIRTRCHSGAGLREVIVENRPLHKLPENGTPRPVACDMGILRQLSASDANHASDYAANCAENKTI